jgi:hypothetical protein
MPVAFATLTSVGAHVACGTSTDVIADPLESAFAFGDRSFFVRRFDIASLAVRQGEVGSSGRGREEGTAFIVNFDDESADLQEGDLINGDGSITRRQQAPEPINRSESPSRSIGESTVVRLMTMERSAERRRADRKASEARLLGSVSRRMNSHDG